MNKLVTYINRGLAAFTISLSTFLVFCVVWQVLSRYVLGKPSTVTDELARYLFMWVALIGAAYTTGLKRHLAIDLLTMKLDGETQADQRNRHSNRHRPLLLCSVGSRRNPISLKNLSHRPANACTGFRDGLHLFLFTNQRSIDDFLLSPFHL